MNTKRTPFARPLRHPISETALEAFRLMRELEGKCTCPPRNWHGEYWKHQQCKACGDWWEQNSILHDALQLRPWQWPAVENPAAENPYSAGSPAAAHWKPKLEAQARWRALEAAERAVKSGRTTVAPLDSPATQQCGLT
jgi:hypothetical protein